jgi:hypothetical protein
MSLLDRAVSSSEDETVLSLAVSPESLNDEIGNPHELDSIGLMPKISIPADFNKFKKRPMNSWIAFRTYYRGLFVGSQQKEISSWLRAVWNSDLFHAKWTLLARTYSIIRDISGRERTPVDRFLQLAGQHIGVIPPESYMDVMGITIISQSDGSRSVSQSLLNNHDVFSKYSSAESPSISSLLQFCFEIGYISPDGGGFVIESPIVEHSLPAYEHSLPLFQQTSESLEPALSMVGQDPLKYANTISMFNLSSNMIAEGRIFFQIRLTYANLLIVQDSQVAYFPGYIASPFGTSSYQPVFSFQNNTPSYGFEPYSELFQAQPG